jgi:hypothetical protein
MHMVENLVAHFGKERIQWLCIGLMQSVADMHVLRTLVAHESSGLHFFFMVITLLVMILLYSCQEIYLSYDMGRTFGKDAMIKL